MVSKVNKFLKILLKGKTTEYSVLFIWKTAFETLVICEVESVIWEERFSSLSFDVPHLISSMLYSPMFSGYEKYTQSWEILVPEIQQVLFLTFSSYSINILPNYLNFLNLAHFLVSRNLFSVIWYLDSKTTEYSVLLVFLANQVCFRICNSEILFFVLACYCLQLITQKQ